MTQLLIGPIDDTNLGRLKTRDRKTRDHQKCRGEKRRTGKRRTIIRGWKTRDQLLWNAEAANTKRHRTPVVIKHATVVTVKEN